MGETVLSWKRQWEAGKRTLIPITKHPEAYGICEQKGKKNIVKSFPEESMFLRKPVSLQIR